MTDAELNDIQETLSNMEVAFDARLATLENTNDEVKAALEEIGKSLHALNTRLQDVEKWRHS